MGTTSYTEFASSDGPYLHYKAYHFRSDVQNALNIKGQAKTLQDLTSLTARLEGLMLSLRAEAYSFLEPWGGDYKRASQEIFNPLSGQGLEKYRSVLNKLINSNEFINIVRQRKYSSKNFNNKTIIEIQQILSQFSNKSLNGMSLNDVATEIVKVFSDASSNQKRITLNNAVLKKKLESLLGKEIEQKYFQNKDSLKKQVLEALRKRTLKINWEGVFRDLEERFLAEFPQDEQAKNYIREIRPSFIAQGEKLKSSDYANISGHIGESLSVSILNNDQSVQVLIKEVGEGDEDYVVKESKRFAMQASAKLGVKVSTSQIKKMNYRNVQAQQSGTDWLIVNKNGKMIRAQVKNSANFAEELRNKEVTRPQVIHLQGEIAYNTFKKNIQNQSAGAIGGLTNEDWIFLDYLISNLLWIRAGGAVKKDKGGAYSSGVSGIQEIINQLLSQEIQYFLGVSINPIGKQQAIETILGGSNIFFVIDNLILYPTWMLIQSIYRQLTKITQSIAKIHVSISSSYMPTRDEVFQTQIWAKREDGSWKPGDPYGSTVLEAGRNWGNYILDGTKAAVNLNINIEQMINEVYEEALRESF